MDTPTKDYTINAQLLGVLRVPLAGNTERCIAVPVRKNNNSRK
jgi:hypothetical protein